MDFLNPLELLGVAPDQASAVDEDQLKKQWKRLQADIALEDDQALDFKGRKVTQTECAAAWDKLSDPALRNYFQQLLADAPLNEFLTTGKVEDVGKVWNSSLWKDPGFVDFVSPYFSPRYQRALSDAIHHSRKEAVAQWAAVPAPLVGAEDQLFSGSASWIRDRVRDINHLKEKVENAEEDFSEKEIQSILDEAKSLLNPEVLNPLPDYFQSVRNDGAQSLRNLSIELFHQSDDAEAANSLLEMADKVHTTGMVKERIRKDKEQFGDILEERRASEQYGPIVKTWTEQLEKIDKWSEMLEKHPKRWRKVVQQVDEMLKTSDPYTLPPELVSLRDRIVTSLRNLAINLWNHGQDLGACLKFMDVAQDLVQSDSIRKRLEQDFETLNEIKKNQMCHYCGNVPGEKGQGKDVAMHKVIERGYNSVRYQRGQLSIPRCKKCKAAHSKSSTMGWLSALGGGLLLFFLFPLFSDGNDESRLIIGLVGGAVGAILGGIIGTQVGKSKYLKAEGIKYSGDWKSHPAARDLLAQGFVVGEKPAGYN